MGIFIGSPAVGRPVYFMRQPFGVIFYPPKQVGDIAVQVVDGFNVGTGLIEKYRPAAEERLKVAAVLWEEAGYPPCNAPFAARVFYDCFHALLFPTDAFRLHPFALGSPNAAFLP